VLQEELMIKTEKLKAEDNMKKIYHLKSCSTNVRILKEVGPGKEVELQNIKEKNIDAEMLDFLKEKVGTYEALFSKKAMKYRSMGLNKMDLTEADYRKYMLEEYTFLKRPFMINGKDVFIGNSKATVADAVLSFNMGSYC
jgi:arsenate reductase